MLNVIGRSNTLNLFIGLTFIAFGILFLLSNYGIIPAVEWNKVWPLIFVIFGITFILRGKLQQGQQPRNSDWL